jgi:hypothetical protein
MTTRLKIQVAFQTGQTLYVLIFNRTTGQVWNTTLNTGAGGWQAYNSANWAQYVIALTELTGSGVYQATYPAGIGADLTAEAVYQQAGGSPALGDAPAAGLALSQGQNVAGVAGAADPAETLRDNLTAVARGLAAGTPTASLVPTDLTATDANVYAGRSVVFYSGAAAGCAGRIVAYAVLNGALTLAAPLAVTPDAGDGFVIV